MSVCVCVTVCVPGNKYMHVGRGVGVEREKEGGLGKGVIDILT